MKRLLAVLAFAASSLGAQSLPLLPRATPTGAAGLRLADSSLIACMDSANTLNRACTFRSVQQRLAFKTFDSLRTVKLTATGLVTGSLGGSFAGTDPTPLYALGVSAPGVVTPLHVLRAGGSGTILLAFVGTSFSAPTGASNGNALGLLNFGGYDGVGALRGGANITGTATETWSPTATGAQLIFNTRANGTTTAAAALTLDQDKSAAFTGTLTTTGLATFNGGATVASGQTLTVTGATITGLTAASVGTGTFPSGTYSFTGATALTGGAGNWTQTCGTGNSRTCTFQSTTSAGTAKNTLVLGADTSATFLGQALGMAGSVSLPSFAFAGDPNTGWYASNGDTIKAATGGVNSLNILGGATVSLVGGAGNMTITAGTGASRTVTLRTTTSGSANQNNIVLDASGANFALDGTSSQPSWTFAGQTGNGLYRSSDTLGLASAGVPALRIISNGTTGSLIGGLSNMALQGGTGNSRTISLSATNGSGVVKTPLQIGSGSNGDWLVLNPNTALDTISGRPLFLSSSADQDLRVITTAASSEASAQVTATSASSAARIYIAGVAAQDILFNAAGPATISGNGVATSFLMQGGVGNMTLLAGTGNNRTMTLQSSNSTGTATSFATSGGDTLKLPGHLIATGLTSEGSTQSSLCVTNGGGQVFINAAATCTVSSRRFKTNIQPLDPILAHRIVAGSNPVTFEYKSGGGKAIGLVAEEADSLDHRLATRDGQGRVNAVNYEQFTVALLVEAREMQARIRTLEQTSQRQQKTLDSLVTALKKGKP